jgi:hypothetical protein
VTDWLHPPENTAQWCALVWLVCMLVALVWATLTYVRMRRWHDAWAQRDPEVSDVLSVKEAPPAVLSVSCPQCGAAPGADCVTANDWGYHVKRYEAAGYR